MDRSSGEGAERRRFLSVLKVGLCFHLAHVYWSRDVRGVGEARERETKAGSPSCGTHWKASMGVKVG